MPDWKVTAAITTYKRNWQAIERAINSVLNQSYPVLELLLIDDNDAESPYSSTIRKETARYKNVRYVPMIHNGGVAAARNRAIDEARGDLIGFLDDDDEWCADKIAKQVATFNRSPSSGIVFVTGKVINDDNGHESFNWQYEVFKERPDFHDMLYTDYVGSASAPLIRLEALRDVGGFIRENQPAVEDYELWIRISKKYPIEGIKELLFIKHTDSKEHVSGNLVKVGKGFRNIYRLNQKDYREDLRARVGILWNISRCGVRGLDVTVIPYVIEWACCKIALKAKQL